MPDQLMKYVLLKKGPDKPFNKLVKFAGGTGVRATAQATEPSDFTHIFAIEAPNQLALNAHVSALTTSTGATSSKSYSLCVTPDCLDLLEMLGVKKNPSYMPDFKFIVFIAIDFNVSIGEKKPPKLVLGSKGRAGIVNKGGKGMLLELGAGTRLQLAKDLEAIKKWRGVKAVRVMHTAPASMHRVLP